MGTPLATYERDGEWLYHAYPLASGGDFRIDAKDVRRGRFGTGTHALIVIAVNGSCAAYSNINVERSEDRGKLVRDALKNMGDVHKTEFPEQRMRSALDGFCFGLWDEAIAEYAGELMAGDLSVGPPNLVLGECIIDQGSTIIFSPPGAGKSYTLMTMGVCLDAGIDTLWSCQRRKVGYINLERGPNSQRYRLARVNKALGLAPDRPLAFLNARGKALATVIDGVRKMIEVHELDVIMLDSISRAGSGSLVGDDVANSITDSLNGLETTWVALAHSPRGDSTHLFGSMHFEAAEDIGIQLLSQLSTDGMTLGVGLKIVKANDIRTGGLSLIALDFADQVGLTAIRPSDSTEFPNIASQRKLSKADAIASYLVDAGATAAPDIADAIGLRRDEVSRELNSNERFMFVGKDGRRSLYGVRQQGA